MTVELGSQEAFPRRAERAQRASWRRLLGALVGRTVAAVPGRLAPLLMFSSDGRGLGANWASVQESFAREHGGRFVRLNCGHYVQNCAPAQIAADTLEFLHELA